MEMTITKLPDGGVRYETERWTSTIYENGRYVRDGKFTEEGLKAIKPPITRMLAQKVRTA